MLDLIYCRSLYSSESHAIGSQQQIKDRQNEILSVFYFKANDFAFIDSIIQQRRFLRSMQLMPLHHPQSLLLLALTI
jgi:hypothetical protein